MKIDTMQSIVQQLPSIMNYLKIPKEYQKDHGHLLGTANQSKPDLTSDIELLVGSQEAQCQYKLVFNYSGVLTKIFFMDEVMGVSSPVERSLPPTMSVSFADHQMADQAKTIAKKVGKTVGKFAIAFGKELFNVDGRRGRR